MRHLRTWRMSCTPSLRLARRQTGVYSEKGVLRVVSMLSMISSVVSSPVPARAGAAELGADGKAKQTCLNTASIGREHARLVRGHNHVPAVLASGLLCRI